MAALFSLWGFKMVAYLATVLGLCYLISKRTKERDAWKAECKDATAAALQAHNELIELQDSIRIWKAQGEAQRIQLAAAVNDATDIRAKFDELQKSITAVPVPMDAEGALGWLADVAIKLRNAK